MCWRWRRPRATSSTFLEATEAAGIMDGLHGTGPFTVFIPTDEAFDAYLEEAGMTQAEVFARCRDAASPRRASHRRA